MEKNTFSKRLTKNLFQRIKKYFSIAAYAFAALELILSIVQLTTDFSEHFTAADVWSFNLQGFLVCFLIALLMFFTDAAAYHINKLLSILIDLLDVVIVVFGLGGFVFKWFPMKWELLPVVLGIIVAVYIIVYAIMLLGTSLTSEQLNKKIMERKEKRKNDGENH